MHRQIASHQRRRAREIGLALLDPEGAVVFAKRVRGRRIEPLTKQLAGHRNVAAPLGVASENEARAGA